ncbi:MAG: DUF1559 domain-containing protein [Planctomycetota bacterium]
MGQVWTKADFDGLDTQGFEGGRGSCLAVTAQGPGADGQLFTADDVYEADLNRSPAFVSSDSHGGDGIASAMDRVRPFYSNHPSGAVFVHADGSTHFVAEDIERRAYILRSHMKSGTR